MTSAIPRGGSAEPERPDESNYDPSLVPVDQSLLSEAPPLVAPALLNKVLWVDGDSARIVEVEAYWGAHDPASHAFGGMTPRNETMFGRGGLLYVYRSYGMHWCANIVLEPEGEAAAVLLRAVEPLVGFERMSQRRPLVRRDHEVSNGPGKLCAALGIVGSDDGVDLLSPSSRIRLLDDGTSPPDDPLVTSRVGIARATENPWRFAVRSNPWVSKGRPSHG